MKVYVLTETNPESDRGSYYLGEEIYTEKQMKEKSAQMLKEAKESNLEELKSAEQLLENMRKLGYKNGDIIEGNEENQDLLRRIVRCNGTNGYRLIHYDYKNGISTYDEVHYSENLLRGKIERTQYLLNRYEKEKGLGVWEELELDESKLTGESNQMYVYVWDDANTNTGSYFIDDRRLHAKPHTKNDGYSFCIAVSVQPVIEEIQEKRINRDKILDLLRKTKTIVTHFGDDLDNKSAIYALEELARAEKIIGLDERLNIERIPAGKIKEGRLNVDTGGHKGSYYDTETIIVDGNPTIGINSATAELAQLGLDIPEQIVELADTIPNRVSPLESRTGISLIRGTTRDVIFALAKQGLLDKFLTDEQLSLYGLKEVHEKQQGIIDNAVKKVNQYTVELGNGEKAVVATEQILGGAQIAYELGANYYASIQQHKSGNGSTFAVTSKPGIKLPRSIQEFGRKLVEEYENSDGTSGVFLNPNGQMLVAGGMKNPDFSVNYSVEELSDKINDLFTEYALESLMQQDKNLDDKIRQAEKLEKEYSAKQENKGKNNE